MCVTFLVFGTIHDKYKLILLNNRDEVFDRHTASLQWNNGVLGGRDLVAKEKGTWLGINREGNIGNLLSITEPKAVKMARGAMPSRGKIVDEFLCQDLSLQDYCSKLADDASAYNGFHFLGLQRNQSGNYELMSLANRYVSIVTTEFWSPGIYGFGNSPSLSPFKKVTFGKQLFAELVDSFDFSKQSENELIDELLKIGKNTTLCYPDDQIKLQTDQNTYKPLCSLFVRFPEEMNYHYGTRSHSIILVDTDDNVTFLEHSMIDSPELREEDKWETCVSRFHIGDIH